MPGAEKQDFRGDFCRRRGLHFPLKVTMNSFYSDPAVRRRLVEFLGSDRLENVTALYLTHSDGCHFQRSELHPTSSLEWFLDRNLDIDRSLADRESLLLHLDVEYVNFDAPAEAYLDARRAFALQQPTVDVIEKVLLEWGIRPLHLITGQGHHFVWRIGLHSEVTRRIAALNPAPELVAACLERAGTGVTAAVSLDQQEAFAGLSLLMEFLAHRIKSQAMPVSLVPVEITAVELGPGATGQRELISIDISEYGDPLHTRIVRMPFTDYLKPWSSGLANELGIEEELMPFKTIPLHEMDVMKAIGIRQDEGSVRDLARCACVRIPREEEGTGHLVDDYLKGELREFHEYFYSTVHDPREAWPFTYSRTPLDPLHPCVSDILMWPNDRLLKPAGIRLVSRSLLEEGWHPRHVAGLIRSKFENPDYGWGVDWNDYEAGTRADFYTRLFAGQWAVGIDRPDDRWPAADNREMDCQWGEGGCSFAGCR
jgi:hypothetical protein